MEAVLRVGLIYAFVILALRGLGSPTVLVSQGELLADNMNRERIPPSEL